jgi:hypothetical protein
VLTGKSKACPAAAAAAAACASTPVSAGASACSSAAAGAGEGDGDGDGDGVKKLSTGLQASQDLAPGVRVVSVQLRTLASQQGVHSFQVGLHV